MGGGWVGFDYSVSSGPFLRFTLSFDLSLSLRCLTIQSMRPGTQA